MKIYIALAFVNKNVSEIFLVLNFKGCNVACLQLASVLLCLTDGYLQSIQTFSKS